MKINNDIRMISQNKLGLFFHKDRWYTQFGQVKANQVITIEVPVMFYSNNPAGGEISARKIGAFTYFNYSPDFRNVSSVGRFCSIAQNVTAGIGGHSLTAIAHSQIFEVPQIWASPFWDCDAEWLGKNKTNNFNNEPRRVKPTKIGNDVWIGSNVTILNGVEIGDGAVIAAGAVVTKDVGPYEIWGGVPAKFIRKKFSDEIIEELLDLQWWNYGPNVLKGLDISSPEKCIGKLRERIEGGFPIYSPDMFEINCNNNEVTKISGNDGSRELCYKF